ncbi:MAG: Secretion system C-terminal sorting domain [Bacteroidota bacterium]
MRYVLALSVLIVCFELDAQSNNYCINSLGFKFHNDSVFASMSLGEPIIQTIKSSNNYLTQGFLQTDRDGFSSFQKHFLGTNISVFPNPFSDQIQIESSITFSAYRLYDIFGKMIESNDYSNELNFSALAPSSYFLVLLADNNEIVFTIKLLKLF